MSFYIDDYENLHISVDGTLNMLGTTSEYEVDNEYERLALKTSTESPRNAAPMKAFSTSSRVLPALRVA